MTNGFAGKSDKNLQINFCINDLLKDVESTVGWQSSQRPYDPYKKGKRKVQGVPQSQAAAHPRHKEQEETNKTKQAQIKKTYKKQ